MADDGHHRPQGWSSFTKTMYGMAIDQAAIDPFPPLGTAHSRASQAEEIPASYASAVDPFNRGSDGESAPLRQKELAVGDLQGAAASSSSSTSDLAMASSSGDSYHQLRKDAIKASRLMSRHARSAATAFQRGDHHRAKELSRQSRQERALAEKLNLEAAAEIMKLRNQEAALPAGTIDLHGLHVREAVAVLQQRLAELEDQISSSLHRSHLTVITGTGSHSRDGPAIPTAVTNFLITNNYRYTEPRPGMISVQLKIRKEIL
ncbi:polyadenylate-binding protein-interacting protein 7 [Selaginella moellendorffii]|uniref:polyadenylate-binding protein-interacting protein 7 n=1 Tax=Selaginella moellendorffii TaxID=88036 RepID=UPI000D1CF076|nr:polyadenylate-binding protein-interacting protein 7 [Selaginella moellendorffii]|eukprot:XP_024542711.1 polyadenylate-binding protein-interacting protein 7 [Selaginella moellendorffii]